MTRPSRPVFVELRRKPKVRLVQGPVLPTPCWVPRLLNGRLGWPYGYSVFSTKGGHQIAAHRWMWARHHGMEVPDGMVVHHRCFHKRCVNPEHLRLETYEENIAISNRHEAMALARLARDLERVPA